MPRNGRLAVLCAILTRTESPIHQRCQIMLIRDAQRISVPRSIGNDGSWSFISAQRRGGHNVRLEFVSIVLFLLLFDAVIRFDYPSENIILRWNGRRWRRRRGDI